MHRFLSTYTALFTHEEMRKWFDTKANTDDLFQEQNVIFMTLVTGNYNICCTYLMDLHTLCSIVFFTMVS